MRDAQPATLARGAFADRGFSEVYLADLDAIGGAQTGLGQIFRQVAECGLRLWVDAGLSTLDRANGYGKVRHGTREPLAGVIAGLESLPGPEMLKEEMLDDRRARAFDI